MECDSVMDISYGGFNLDDLSELHDVSMEVSAAATPGPESWTRNTTENKVETNILESLQKTLLSIPNGKMISESRKKTLEALHEKQKALETEVVKTEMKREAQKKVLAEELHSLQAVKEENKNVETQLAMAQSKITSLTKVKEGLKHQASSSDKENSSDKKRVDLYRQLTGVTFSWNENCPQELKGFAATAGPTTNLKTFSFNTSEHTNSLISGYIWNVLEDMHKKNWEKLSD